MHVFHKVTEIKAKPTGVHGTCDTADSNVSVTTPPTLVTIVVVWL